MTTSSEFHLEDKVIEREGDPSYYEFSVEDSGRHVRAVLGGVEIASSRRVKLLHESKHMPIYYFPADDVRMDLLQPSGRRRDFPVKGPADYFDVVLPDPVGRTVANAAWIHPEPSSPVAGPLAGMVAFYWKKMDRWYEEDDEVYVHPRDPYHRVDVLNSSRHVQVIVQGQLIAESRRPRLLFETRLPTRFYLPWSDVRADLLVPSTTSSQCPYKGVASYWSVRLGDTVVKDLAWVYQYPIPECPKIENLVCFFNEQVDAIIVDGVEEPRPVTAWSKAPQILTYRAPKD